ncbi:MAG TPA: S41 family peptidase, partial [Pyrinomonadaceae bacterium]|nr:S41 family peptidase [Pyrinomonadaceae bacterium]
KKVIILLTLTILHFCSAHFANAQTNEKWLQDYEAMKKFMAEGYANLEWARNDKKIDLVALDKKTKEELSKAASDQESRQILENFLKTFRDGHLNLREVKETSSQNTSEPQPFAPDAPGDKVCSALGYRIRFNRFSIPFDQAPNFKLVSTDKDYFPAGIFTLENGKSYGVLKIGLFSSDGYFGNCTASWEEFRAKITEPCKGVCIYEFHRATDNRLSAKLTEQIKNLQEQKIDNLIVDIGGNGGGSNWVEAAARILSPKPLRSTSSGFIRHPHYVKILENRLKDVSEDLTRKDLNARQKGYLKTAKERLEQLIKEA